MMTNEEAIRILEFMKSEMLLSFDHDRKEALKLAISALETQIPKETVKPESPYFKFACPTCGNHPLSGHYCGECGQRIVYHKEGEE